jgi:hypothetical protein
MSKRKIPNWDDGDWKIIIADKKEDGYKFYLEDVYLGTYDSQQSMIQAWKDKQLWQYFTPLLSNVSVSTTNQTVEKKTEKKTGGTSSNGSITTEQKKQWLEWKQKLTLTEDATEKQQENNKTAWYIYGSGQKLEKQFVGWFASETEAMDYITKHENEIFTLWKEIYELENERLYIKQHDLIISKIENHIGYIALTNQVGIENPRYAMVDESDFDRCKALSWHLKSDSAYNDEYGKMENFLMKPQRGKTVTHLNQQALDNRRSNLLICIPKPDLVNRKISKRNTSGCTGVYWDDNLKRWIAHITRDRKRIHLGSFVQLSDAVTARRQAELD